MGDEVGGSAGVAEAGHPPDHPVALAHPEGEYLKVLVLAAAPHARAAEQQVRGSAEVEQQDFAEGSPRGNAIGRMVDASEIAHVAAFLASDKAWAVTGELIVATGGAGRSVYY